VYVELRPVAIELPVLRSTSWISKKSYLGIVDVNKRNADITSVILAAQDVKDMNIEHHKSSESVINDFYFQGCQATWNKSYYSSLLSEP
jgi:hypothetical protein